MDVFGGFGKGMHAAALTQGGCQIVDSMIAGERSKDNQSAEE